MLPDLKAVERLGASDPRGYKIFKMTIRVAGAYLVLVLLSIAYCFGWEFHSKNTFDANSYPLKDLVIQEGACAVFLIVVLRYWIWSWKKI